MDDINEEIVEEVCEGGISNSMKKLTLILICMFMMISLVACGGMSVSTEKYEEISSYVLENVNNIVPETEIEFYEYENKGLSIGSTYYGYYYTINNEVVVPDFYSGDDLGKQYEADGGTYFGKPNDGTDWCFIKKIADNWYYYELHWA